MRGWEQFNYLPISKIVNRKVAIWQNNLKILFKLENSIRQILARPEGAQTPAAAGSIFNAVGIRCAIPLERIGILTELSKYRVPGAALAINRGGELVYSKGRGVPRMGESSPINAQTVFPAASLTKPVFAYGALMLVRDGMLDLDRPRI